MGGRPRWRPKADAQVWLEYIEGERLRELVGGHHQADRSAEHRPKYTPAPLRGGAASPECLAEVLLECLHGNVSMDFVNDADTNAGLQNRCVDTGWH